VQLSFDQLVVPEHSEHVHAGYTSVEFSSDKPLDPARLMALLREPPAGLYRVKGFVHFGLDDFDDKFTLHKVGRHIRFTRSPWRAGETAATSVVAIGADTDRDDLAERLQNCVGVAAERDTIFQVLRHTTDSRRVT
jgi:G3E family GTPase